ncbi:hypothetical protein M2132_001746 [Dysgonomonas sp. PH5-45]|uniref:DUF4271 domain-containing protein n=1 Tax=unclassified Dysgonomonas TaxID=2630389 RepID=UPI002474298A|nr:MULTISPECIES: DUF4271 domain-containing protein [unclassified Dysgonomonas]MDH6355404.1 hypothetical protein [Dysgonomonas sp. PH5-45]MDH6388301.1 hypothetical protein [Dysgonomonas sp. PH5-37]
MEIEQDSITTALPDVGLLPATQGTHTGIIKPDSVSTNPRLLNFSKQDTTTYSINQATDTLANESLIDTVAPVKAYTAVGHKGKDRLPSLKGEDGIFALLLLSFMLLAFVYKRGISLFDRRGLLSLLSDRSERVSFKETTAADAWGNGLLFFQAILLSSIVLYDLFFETSTYITSTTSSFITVILFVVTLFIFVGIKYVFYKFMGYLFDVQGLINTWKKDYVSLINIFGICIFLPTLVLIYADHFHFLAFLLSFILFILTRLVIFYRTISFFLQQKVNFLFLITYLCSVEILPYISLYFGLNFLFETDIINIL